MNGESSWLKDGVEAIKKIVDESVSVKPVVLEFPKEKPGTYGVYVPGKPGDNLDTMLQMRVAGPLWHNEQLADVDNLVAFVEKHSSDTGKGSVFVDDGIVTFVYDEHDRRDRASTRLEKTDQWQILSKPLPPMEQKQIIRLLRINFNGALIDNSLINILRELKFDSSGKIESTVNHGNAALGKQITNQITGVNTIPDQFALNLQVYKNFPQKVQILCAIELHPEIGKIEIVPFPNELETGLLKTLESIRLKFAATEVPSYLGAVRGQNE